MCGMYGFGMSMVASAPCSVPRCRTGADLMHVLVGNKGGVLRFTVGKENGNMLCNDTIRDTFPSSLQRTSQFVDLFQCCS